LPTKGGEQQAEAKGTDQGNQLINHAKLICGKAAIGSAGS
jgi:hypothetical protein